MGCGRGSLGFLRAQLSQFRMGCFPIPIVRFRGDQLFEQGFRICEWNGRLRLVPSLNTSNPADHMAINDELIHPGFAQIDLVQLIRVSFPEFEDHLSVQFHGTTHK
ncbi:MAG: hypothetical protein R3C11_12730 [Planctomycetaceae bacterium]